MVERLSNAEVIKKFRAEKKSRTWLAFSKNRPPELFRMDFCQKCDNLTDQRECLLDKTKWQCMSCQFYLSTDCLKYYTQEEILKNYSHKNQTYGYY